MRTKTLINKIAMNTVRVLFFRIVLLIAHAKVKRYKPKSKNFLVIGNHSDGLDPIYIMCSLKKYIRFVAGDHVVMNPWANFFLRKLAGWIIKGRDNPAYVLTNEMKASAAEGVPTGLFAEGTITPNGETGFFSPRTGQLVKDMGVALITYRIKGGYFHAPRWGTGLRKGPIHGKVVREYSVEELEKMTVEEINEVIKRDIYVNAFDEQRKRTRIYKGKNLAEHIERILYICPHCEQVGTLHSKGNYLTCECGYQVEFGRDGFFHESEKQLVFDNALDWDKWQKKLWKDKVLGAEYGELIFEEKNQIIYTLIKNKKVELSEDAVLRLYKDKFEIVLNPKQTIEMPIEKLTLVLNVSVESLMFVDSEHFLYVKSKNPRAAAKYVAAWRYLIGKDYK